MAANGEFEDEIRGMENDYFDFDSRDFSDDDDDGRESESGTGSEGVVTVTIFQSELLCTSRPRLALRLSRLLECQQAVRHRRRQQGMVTVLRRR